MHTVVGKVFETDLDYGYCLINKFKFFTKWIFKDSVIYSLQSTMSLQTVILEYPPDIICLFKKSLTEQHQ